MDNINISTTEEFAKYINSKIDKFNFEVKKNKPLEINKEQINMLYSLFENKSNEWSKEFTYTLLNDILKKPCRVNGKVYEALVYSWLDSHKIDFIPQAIVESENCLKKNNYESDGKIKDIYFDVKQFGITLPHLDTLKEKLQRLVPKKYFVTVGGTKNISTRVLKEHYLSRLKELVEEIMSEKNKVYTDYLFKDTEHGIEIRLHDKASQEIFSSISEFNYYEWAESNQFYFMYHASQFCINNPYIIICPFDNSCCSLLSHNTEKDVYHILRPFCRRMFMNLINMHDIDISEYDENAKEGIKVATAAKKVSAVVFLDVTKEYDYSNQRMWVFLNPNADNKLRNYQVNSLFRHNGAYVEDFRFDNY